MQRARAWAADNRDTRRAGPSVLIALCISPFAHQHRADEARDRHDHGAHLEGFVGALEAGHQFPAFLNLAIEDVFQGRQRILVMGAYVDYFVTQ